MSVSLPDCDTSAPDFCSTWSLGSKASTPEDGGEKGVGGDSGNSKTGDDNDVLYRSPSSAGHLTK